MPTHLLARWFQNQAAWQVAVPRRTADTADPQKGTIIRRKPSPGGVSPIGTARAELVNLQ